MPQLGTICITNQAPNKAIIDIEGIIGIPEWWQFDDPEDRVATFDKFKKKCNEIRNLKATEVTVNIRSIGGDVNHALLIHDSLCQIENVTTVCYGYTASAATLIAQAGKTRQVSSNALYLIHQCSTVARGNIADLKDTIDTMEKTNDRIVNLYSTRTGKPADHFREILNRKNGNGEWLSPEETVNLGLADEIVTVSGAVNIDLDLFANMGYPEIPENLFPNPQEPADTNPSNNNFMTKIKNTLSALWAFCNFPADREEQEITDEHLLQVNNELAARQETINNLTTQRDQLKTSISAKDQKITELENTITELKNKPGATTTEPTNATDNGSTGSDDMTSLINNATELYKSVKDL